MKSRFSLMVILSILVLLFASAFAPVIQEPPGELPTELVALLVGALIPVVVQIMKLAAAWFGMVWKEKTVMLICAGIGLIAAVLWMRPAFPPLPPMVEDPMVYVGSLITFGSGCLAVISSLFGLATLVYIFVLRKIFEGLGMGKAKIQELSAFMLPPSR